ncbi:MAG: hypothetical protein IJ300_12790 [Clostridia bacterium]|nr:hypothetical protein [Clostridia bacterium]
MLATLDFYRNVYGSPDKGGVGKIPEGQFELWEHRAETELNRIVSGRLEEASQLPQTPMLVCEMAEALFVANTRKGIASENNDGYSVTYQNEENSSLQKELYDIAKRYLSETNLLYRGVL